MTFAMYLPIVNGSQKNIPTMMKENFINQKVNKKIVDTLKNFYKNSNSWGFGPVELGINKAIISKVILKVKRSISPNYGSDTKLFPFLVRDELQIGLRLGANFVISGDISYIKKYTLVYPIKERKDAMGHHHELINLFIPSDIVANKLPQQHILILEDFFESRGGVEFNIPNATMFGLSFHAGTISLTRTLINHKSNEKVLIYKEKEDSNKVAFQLYANLLLFDLPLFDLEISNGHIHRRLLEVDLTEFDNQVLLSNFMQSNSIASLAKRGTWIDIQSSFKSNASEFELFWIYNWENFNRIDYVTIINPIHFENSNDYYLQLQNQKVNRWFLPSSGEKHSRNLTLISKLKDPIDESFFPNIEIELKINDKRTRTSELKKHYLSLFNKLFVEKQDFSLNKEFSKNKKQWGHVYLRLLIQFSKASVKNLINKIPKLEQFLERKRINQKSLTLKKRFYLRRLDKFVSNLKRFKNSQRESQKIRFIMLAFRALIPRTIQSYNLKMLQFINKLLNQEGIYIEAQLDIPQNKANAIAKYKRYEKIQGGQKINTNYQLFYIPKDINHIWNLF